MDNQHSIEGKVELEQRDKAQEDIPVKTNQKSGDGQSQSNASEEQKSQSESQDLQVEKDPETNEVLFPIKPEKGETFEQTRENLIKFKEFLDKETFEEKNTLRILKYLHRYYWDFTKRREKAAILLIELKYPESFKKLLWYANSVGVFKSDSVWFPVYYTVSVLWNFTDASSDLAKKLLDLEFIKYYAENLKHQPYLENQSNKNVAYMLKASLSTIQNCVRHAPGDPAYEKEALKDILKPYLSSETDMFRTLSIMILSNILSEAENSKLEDAASIPYMVRCLSKACSSAKRRHNGFSVIELLECIARIAVNDENKIKLVDAGVLPHLVKVMTDPEAEEQQMAARIIWILCFDKDVKNKVIEEAGCVDALNTLSQSENETLAKAAKGALWKISGEEKHQKETTTLGSGEKHIFISYQHLHQEVVIRVKDQLKRDGYKVWIDVEHMGGSTLESMALAIENAVVVLMCVSEPYKLSPSCRTEGEYTYQWKRPLVPLMMQRHYKPDGWLGIMLGTKLYINFNGKFDFDTAYKMLLKELSIAMKGGNDVIQPVDVTDGHHGAVTFAAPPMQREVSAVKWDKVQVTEWMAKSQLTQTLSGNNKLQALFEKLDGRLLVQFCKMRKEAPEFFYNSLKSQYDLEMFDLIQLGDALDSVM